MVPQQDEQTVSQYSGAENVEINVPEQYDLEVLHPISEAPADQQS
jgi:hypothetical protein